MAQAADGSELDHSQTRSPRFTQWLAFLVFSTVTLGSAVELKNKDKNSTNSDQRWAVACSAITFSVTAIVVLMHLNSVTSLLIVGTKIEGAICIILVAFWAATVAIVSDARNGLAVDSDGAVNNGNLYYFSWAGFVTSILLIVSYLRSAFHVDVAGEIKARSARLTTWAALLASSLIVMGTSARVYDRECEASSANREDDTFCHRTMFGLVLGAVSTILALAIVAMKIATAKAPFMVEAIFGLGLCIAFGFGVAFITGSKGPGSPLGNLYYFSWISFLATFMLCASCVEDYRAAKSMTYQSGEANNQGTGESEIQVESLDDTI